MNDSFITDLPVGALPIPMEEPIVRQICDEVTLTIVLCHYNKETDRVVVRFALDSPYWIDEHDSANGTWSLALPRFEMMKLLCTLIRSPFMKVILKREELLCS